MHSSISEKICENNTQAPLFYISRHKSMNIFSGLEVSISSSLLPREIPWLIILWDAAAIHDTSLALTSPALGSHLHKFLYNEALFYTGPVFPGDNNECTRLASNHLTGKLIKMQITH